MSADNTDKTSESSSKGDSSVIGRRASGRPAAPQPTRGRTSRKAPQKKSRAALVAFLMFAWGQSLLLFDALRRWLFDADGSDHLILVAPAFLLAIVAGGLAWRARSKGRSAAGGSMAHGFGVASAMLALVALVLGFVLAPRMRQRQEDARELAAVRQLEDVAAALARYARVHAIHPTGGGAAALEVLSPEFLAATHPLRDPWGEELEYRSLSEGRGYLLLSRGRDHEQDLLLADYVESPEHALLGNDLVLINGRFLRSGLAALERAPRAWHREELQMPVASTGPSTVPAAPAARQESP